ncbi:hypothetical protein [Mesorhizobium sp.]|nr:hypothetical protein [Mesorhizobium sp.]
MTGTKHPRWKKPSDADLVNNPGIGTSKGLRTASIIGAIAR